MHDEGNTECDHEYERETQNDGGPDYSIWVCVECGHCTDEDPDPYEPPEPLEPEPCGIYEPWD